MLERNKKLLKIWWLLKPKFVKKTLPKSLFFSHAFFLGFCKVWVVPVNWLFLSRDLPENAFLGGNFDGFLGLDLAPDFTKKTVTLGPKNTANLAHQW